MCHCSVSRYQSVRFNPVRNPRVVGVLCHPAVEIREPLAVVGNVLVDLTVGHEVVLGTLADAHQYPSLVGCPVVVVQCRRPRQHCGVVTPHRDAVLELPEHLLYVPLVGLVGPMAPPVGHRRRVLCSLDESSVPRQLGQSFQVLAGPFQAGLHAGAHVPVFACMLCGRVEGRVGGRVVFHMRPDPRVPGVRAQRHAQAVPGTSTRRRTARAVRV